MTDHLAAVTALPGVEAAALEARRVVDSLLSNKLMRRRSADVAVEAGLRSATASAALDGVPVDGPLRLAGELGPLAKVLERAPMQALARAHLLACTGLVPEAELGRPRESADLPRLQAVFELIGRPTTAPAVVVAAIVHGELLAVQPFSTGNGVVARAVARAVLVNRGLDPRGVTAPDVGHAADPATYHLRVQAYASGADLSGWAIHCADALADGAREGLAICAALGR